MKLRNLLDKKEILAVLILAFLVRLVLSMKQFAMTWDSAVYLGMGKAIFSFGSLGLWEPIRPILWPIVIGFLWKLKLDPINTAIVVQIVLQVASVYLLYKITYKIFHKDLALLASLLFMFSPILLESAFSLHSASLAMFLCLLSVYLFLNEKFFASGIFASLTFLTTFYYGIFLVIFLIFLIRIKRFEPYKLLIGGFCIPLVPYLIFNLTLYRDPLLPFFSANNVIKNAVACNFLYPHQWYYFFIWMFIDNPLNILMPVGLFYLFKKREIYRLFVFAGFALPLTYLLVSSCRLDRYLMFLLPFLAIITALGIENIMQKLKKHYKVAFLCMILALTVAYPLYRMFAANNASDNPAYYNYSINATGNILTDNPKLALYTDSKLELLYYPLYSSEKAKFYTGDVVSNQRDYIFLDTCYGDIVCNPNDKECPAETKGMITAMKENYRTMYYSNYTMCEYFIFSRK